MPIISPTADDRLWSEYLECRYRNLYAPFNLPRTCTTSELDAPRDRPGILHRCTLVDNTVRAVGRLDIQPDRPEGPSAQLRYFAVDEPARGTGTALELLRELERLAREHGAKRLWMEARVAALGFYTRAGYGDIGEGPNKWGVIPHRVLARTL